MLHPLIDDDADAKKCLGSVIYECSAYMPVLIGHLCQIILLSFKKNILVISVHS